MIAASARLFVLAGEKEQSREEPESLEFERVYAELAPVVQRFLGDLLRDRALAADATQETFGSVLPTTSCPAVFEWRMTA